jgi:hypothetical protein
MHKSVAALVALAVLASAAGAAAAPALYRAMSPQQMRELLSSAGATNVREQQINGKSGLHADTPAGPIEVGFLECHEQPNPCGYILLKRYRNLTLSPGNMQEFNRTNGFAYLFRETGTNDVMLAYPVAMRTGLSRDYIVSSFGLLTGVSEVFEQFASDVLHLPAERIHAE